MGADNEKPTPNDKSDDNQSDVEISALESAENHVAGSSGAGQPCDGSSKAFAAAFNALVDWGQAHSLIRQESDCEFLGRRPDAHGQEHEAWYDASSGRWFKLTYPNRFGKGWFSSNKSASPREYLTRLVLANRYFSDDVQLVALVNCGKQLRVFTSQSHIAGEAAPYEEIKLWFVDFGFICLQSDGFIAWYRKSDNLLVADAHEGNVIKNLVGNLVPIDINITQPHGALLDWALSDSSLI